MNPSIGIVVIALLVLQAAAREFREPPPGSNVPRPLKNATKMPSLGNDRDVEELTCFACLSVGRKIAERLETVRVEFARQPQKLRSYHLLAATSELCEQGKMNVGLKQERESKAITAEFLIENEPEAAYYSIVKGGWVTDFWERHCFVVMDRVEDQLMKLFKGENVDICRDECKNVNTKPKKP